MWIEKTRNGKYKLCERYIDPMTGKTKRATLNIEKDTKACRKAAEDVLRAKIKELTTYTKEAKDQTISDLADAYIEHQKKATKVQTWTRDEMMIKKVRDIIGADVLAAKLNARYILQQLDRTGKKNVTKNTYLKHFRKMIRWAYQEDYIEDIAFLQKIKNYPDNKKERIEDKFLSSDDLKQLLAGMKNTRWKLLTHFLALSGLRIGEAMALNNSDLTTVISVTKTMDPQTGRISSSAKTAAGNREVFIQPELSVVVKKIRSFVLLDKFQGGYRSNLFFPGIHYYAYNKYLKETSEKILQHMITPHALRHTHVSLLAENGIPLDAISRRVGHEDSEVTRKIYLHVTEKQKEKDIEELKKVTIL